MKHFVYITTNLITGEQYVGDHSTDNLNDGYLGSGIYIKHALKKYKRINFKRKIIEFFDTKKEAFNAQEKYINEYNTLSPNGYNISPCGGIANNNCYLTEEHKEKIRIAQTNRPYREPWNKGKTNIYSEETLKKMSKANKGRRWSEESKENLKEKRKGPKNGMYNKKHSKDSILKMKLSKQNISEETKQKMSKAHIGKKIKRKKCEICFKEIPVNVFKRHKNKCINEGKKRI